MPFVLADRVKETTTTTGTGTVTLAGAVTGYQSFSAIGNGNTTYYTIAGQGTAEWEVGIGTYTSSGTTLSRTYILASSNSNSAVNFSAGTKDVFVTYPAGKAVIIDTNGAPSSGQVPVLSPNFFVYYPQNGGSVYSTVSNLGSTAGSFARFYAESASSGSGSVTQYAIASGGSWNIGQDNATTSFKISNDSSGTLTTNTRFMIDSSGNTLIGGTAARGTTVGTKHLDLFDGTAPAGTLTNGVSVYSSSGDLNFMNSAGNGFKVGYRNLPPVGTQTGSYTLAVGDVGKYVQVGTGGSITIPTSTFAEGDAISIANNTTGNITITCSAPTAYIAGTNTVKTSMTLATRGVATVLFISSTVCFVTGNVT